MKKLGLLLMIFLSLFLSACKDKNKIDANLEIADITLTKGQEVEIDYKIKPAGTFGVVSFEILEGEDKVSITGTTLKAIEVGSAKVKAIATNMKGASKSFSAETNFKVTINPITAVAGEYILNGGFELDVLEWNLKSDPENYIYGTTVVDNYPHSGEAALNLWFDANADEVGEALDLSLSQELSGVKEGNYLFSLWYQGSITSLEMSVMFGDDLLANEVFSGYDYKAVPEHNGYVQYGIEVDIDGTKDITIIIKLLGEEDCWGYLDDISFKEGDLDDLIKAPEADESKYVNFIKSGAFNSLENWTIEITGEASEKKADLENGKLSIWADGVACFKVYQEVILPDEKYNFVIYFNGGLLGDEFNAEDAYLYVSVDEDTYKLDIEPTGWGTGDLTRIELSDLNLSGKVEVGIYLDFTSGSNNWVNFDDFALYSPTLDIKEEDLTAATVVSNLIDNLNLDTLSLDDEDSVIAAREAYEALSSLQKILVENEEHLIRVEAEILVLKNPSPEGYLNFGGDFGSSDDFITEITGDVEDKGIIFDGQLKIWAKGEANISVKQVLSDLRTDTYQLLIELNGARPGSEFNTSDAYIYVKQGEKIKSEDLIPEGWNDGKYKKLYLLNIDIEEGEDVEIGIKIIFTDGTNNWINFDNFYFWSLNIPTPEPTSEDIALALAFDSLVDEISLDELTLEDEERVLSARDAYELLTDMQKGLVNKLESLEALEAKLLELKGEVDYPVVSLDEFNLQGGFESADYALETLKWKFEGGHGWTKDDWTVAGDYRYDVFQSQDSLNARIYKGIKDLSFGTYELTFYLAGGMLSEVFVKIGNTTHEIANYSGDYQEFKIYHEYNDSEHLYFEIAIVREEEGWASLDEISLKLLDYPVVSLDDFNLQGGFEGDSWSMEDLKWTVLGGNMWIDGDWAYEGDKSYGVFKEVDSLSASISKGILIENSGTYLFKVFLAGENYSKLQINLGEYSEEVLTTGEFLEYSFELNLEPGLFIFEILVERETTDGWTQIDNLSLSLIEE